MTILGDTAIGWSAHGNAFAAGQAAARSALKGLSEPLVQYALVFGSSWFDQAQLIGGVRSVVHSTPILGGSTAGEITPDGPKTHSCVVLLVGGSDMAVVGIGHGLSVGENPRLAGYQAAQQALKSFGNKHRAGFLFFGDGLLTGYAEVLRGIQEVLGTSSLVTGALMADDLRFAQTYQYHDEILSGAVVGMLLGGACTVGVGVEHGFEPISKPRQITRARANVLYELDGQPASSVYDEYFGPSLREASGEPGLSRHLVAYPLGVQLESTGHFLLRNIRSFGSDGSLSCTGEITEGGWVQLMIGSREPALDAAQRAAQQALRSVQHPRFVLVFDSVVRKRLLGRDAAEEIRRIRQAAGPDVPVLGCYTYGEQTPLGNPYPYGRSSVQTGACLVVAVGR